MKSEGGKEPASGRAGDAGSAPGTSPAKAATGPPSSKEDPTLQRLKALEDERDRLKAELADTKDRYLRARADYDNLVKRSTKDALDSMRAARGSLLLRFAGVAETLEKAHQDLDKAVPANAKGVKLVLDDVRKLLKDEGIKEIETHGQAFNFRFHQAVERVETAEKPEGTILEVVQRGYLLGGEILRPALVKVAVPPRKPVAKGETAQTA